MRTHFSPLGFFRYRTIFLGVPMLVCQHLVLLGGGPARDERDGDEKGTLAYNYCQKPE